MQEKEQQSVLSPLLILLIAALAGTVLWQLAVSRMQPGLDEAGRARIIEPLIDECFYNSLLLAARVEKNNEEAYEILSETKEYDEFSKREIRVVHRGKKLRDPETGCELNIKRERLVGFYSAAPVKFKMSQKNAAAWHAITKQLRELGVLSAGSQAVNIYFEDCMEAKKLYERMQAFLAVSRSYGYNFDH